MGMGSHGRLEIGIIYLTLAVKFVSQQQPIDSPALDVGKRSVLEIYDWEVRALLTER